MGWSRPVEEASDRSAAASQKFIARVLDPARLGCDGAAQKQVLRLRCAPLRMQLRGGAILWDQINKGRKCRFFDSLRSLRMTAL
jgi:hypothetical protein